MASPEARRLEGLEGGVSDGGEAQRSPRHPRDIIEAARLLVTRGYVETTSTGTGPEVRQGSPRVNSQFS